MEFHAEAAGISFGTREFVVAVAPERCPSGCVETFPSFTADLGRRGSLRIAACRTWAAPASGRKKAPAAQGSAGVGRSA
jgi:hypothetical protein